MRDAKLFFLAFGLLALGGCATIIGGGSSQPVTLSAEPSEATYTITSSTGIEMASGGVPASVRLPRKNEYQVNVSLEGYETRTLAITKGTNGWIWGNLLFGWIFGFAVDFLTGAAYKLEPSVINVSLERGVDTVAIVHFLNSDGELLGEERLTMVPVR